MKNMKTKILALSLAVSVMILLITGVSVHADEYVEPVSIESATEDGSTLNIISEAYSDTGYYRATYDTEPVNDTVSLDNTSSVPYTDDESVIYQRLISMNQEYYEGRRWTNSDTYVWYNIYYPEGSSYAYSTYTGGGCVAFCMILSDAAFGDIPAYQKHDVIYDKLRTGDILRINNNSHSVIILEKNEDGVIIAEGNFNSSVHWGSKLSRAAVESADYYVTRYEEVYNCSFESNGGSPVQSVKVKKSKRITEPDQPVKDGYYFDGWFKDKELTKSWNFQKDIVTDDITLYAKWSKAFVASFETSGGTELPKVYADKNGYVKVPESPVKQRYVLKAWCTDPSLKTEAAVQKDKSGNKCFKISADTTFFAKWTVDENLLLKNISLDRTELILSLEKSAELNVTLTPFDNPAEIKWSTDNDCITVSPSANGRSAAVSAVKRGHAVITVTAIDKFDSVETVKSTSAKVFVKRSGEVLNATITAGEQTDISKAFFDDECPAADFNFAVSPQGFATVNKKGILTAKKAGSITVQALDKSGDEYDRVNLNILPLPVIKFTKPLTYSGQTVSIFDAITNVPADCKYIFTKFESTKKEVADIDDNGIITAGNKSGTATIKAYIAEKDINGSVKTLSVKANISVKCPEFAKSSYTLQTGQTMTIGMKNVNAASGAVFSSEDPDRLDVSAQMKKDEPTGKIILKALNADKDNKPVLIYAVIDGQKYTCSVNITCPVIAKPQLRIKAGKTGTVALKNTKIKKNDIEWKSEDESIATVEPGGKVTAKGTGTVKIYTITGGIRNECDVTVYDK